MKRTAKFVLLSIAGAMVAWLVNAPRTLAATMPERHASAAQRQSLTVIVYGDFALVRDVRLVNVEAGENRVAFDDVSPQMSPETAFLSDLSSGAPILVKEQNFETAVLSPDAIFARAVGHTVTVIRDEPMTGKETRETAVVISASGPILKFKDRFETGLPPNSRIVYTTLPIMRLTPDFLADFESQTAARHPIALGYLTGGLSWAADYVARLNAGGDHLDIDAFITLHNDSGMDFDNATVRVVAGSVQRAAPGEAKTLGMVRTQAAADVYAANAGRATRQAVFEFYEYSLPQRTSLRTGETKQTLLLFARGVPVQQIFSSSVSASDFQSQGGEQLVPVEVTLEFDNDGHGLGVPLPSGVFHMYKNDESGEPVFIGENAIDNTPSKQHVQLDLGPSFDVRVRRVQTNYQEIPHPNNRTEYVTDYRVTVTNARPKAVVLHYEEQLSGLWQIASETLPHQKISSSTVVWVIPVPAGGQATLTFQVDSR